MNPLVERIRKARQTRVSHNGKTFIVRRPTYWEARLLQQSGNTLQMDVLERFVEGWEEFAEMDFVAGGDAEPVDFDKELFLQWVQDHPEYWTPLTSAIADEYKAYQATLEESEKK